MPYFYLVRNRDIVEETDLLIAAPANAVEHLQSGTWCTVRYARRSGRHSIIRPDGTGRVCSSRLALAPGQDLRPIGRPDRTSCGPLPIGSRAACNWHCTCRGRAFNLHNRCVRPLFGTAKRATSWVTLVENNTNRKSRRMIMKAILAALIVISALAGAATSASAFDSKTFWEQQDRSHY